MSRLSHEQQVQVAAHLVDGCSIRATERLCHVNRDTIMSWGLRLGEACRLLHDALVCGLDVDLLQVDELWGFVKKKNARLMPGDDPTFGDEYTYVGLDATKKLIVAYRVGKRTGNTTDAFALDLRRRIRNRPHISSDGYKPYIDAIKVAFGGGEVDYGQVVKQYGGTPSRYQGCVKTAISGNPRMEDISTSLIERENLTMRRSIGRLHRKTYAFSKKFRPHCAAVSLYVAHYNFCRVHETLKTTPAVAAGIIERPWSLGELIWGALSIAPAAASPGDESAVSRTQAQPERASAA